MQEFASIQGIRRGHRLFSGMAGGQEVGGQEDEARERAFRRRRDRRLLPRLAEIWPQIFFLGVTQVFHTDILW
jgi:hypothetical protein